MLPDTRQLAAPRASPLVGALIVREQAEGRLVASFSVHPGEPVLAGHFPGFPILPGVCLVECAHQVALLALAETQPTMPPFLAAVERARFLAPVFPGDDVLVDLSVRPIEGGWRCPTRLVVRRPGESWDRDAATVRLRYRDRGAGHAGG